MAYKNSEIEDFFMILGEETSFLPPAVGGQSR